MLCRLNNVMWLHVMAQHFDSTLDAGASLTGNEPGTSPPSSPSNRTKATAT